MWSVGVGSSIAEADGPHGQPIKYPNTMANQKQDQGTTQAANPNEKGATPGSAQERNNPSGDTRTADKDEQREDQRSGQSGAQYGTPSSLHEQNDRNEERATNTADRNTDGRIGKAHDGGDRKEGGTQGDRTDGAHRSGEDSTGTRTADAQGAHKGDESEEERSGRTSTVRH